MAFEFDSEMPDLTPVVIMWEAGDEGIDPFRVLAVQLPPDQTSLTLPSEWLSTYVEVNDVTTFKFVDRAWLSTWVAS